MQNELLQEFRVDICSLVHFFLPLKEENITLSQIFVSKHEGCVVTKSPGRHLLSVTDLYFAFEGRKYNPVIEVCARAWRISCCKNSRQTFAFLNRFIFEGGIYNPATEVCFRAWRLNCYNNSGQTFALCDRFNFTFKGGKYNPDTEVWVEHEVWAVTRSPHRHLLSVADLYLPLNWITLYYTIDSN